ncbi:MAG: SH3 domain-containing protein [Clostridia bacterium]|nr:SH3 domain-containing protein [Clostridia bacterium]
MHLNKGLTETVENVYKIKCSQEADAYLRKFCKQYRTHPSYKTDEQIKKIISVYVGMVTYNGKKIFSDDAKEQITEHWDSWIGDVKPSKEVEETPAPRVKNKKIMVDKTRAAIVLAGVLLIGLLLGWIVGHVGSSKGSDKPVAGSAVVAEQGSADIDTKDNAENSEKDNDIIVNDETDSNQENSSSGIVSVGGKENTVTATLLQVVNLRETASSESKRIMQLNKDQEIMILGEESDGWIQISVQNEAGETVTGFIRTMIDESAVYQTNERDN